MKTKHIIVLLALLWVFGASAQKTVTITILHSNDTHSCILPFKAGLPDTLSAGRGGFLRRIALIREELEKDPELLYFDSGDFSQGSPYYTLFKGDVEVGLMNSMGCDASTIGNHEFDYGLDNLAKICKQARFPLLCANYDVQGSPLEGLIKPYKIFRVKGVKIGVFGLGTELEGLVSRENYGTLKYIDPAKAALETARLLKRKKKCDVVICLSHLGWGLEGQNDAYMIAGSRDIDLVLGGHSHTYFTALRYADNLDGRPVPVDQNGKSGVYIGKITLTLKKK